MAIQLPTFRQLTAADEGGFDLTGALKSGYDAYNKFQEGRYKPKTLAEQLLASQLDNKIKEITAKYAEPTAQARLQKLLRGPAPALSNIEKALQGVGRVEQIYGKDSPQAKMAQAYAQRISQGSNGITVGIDPDTGLQTVQIGGSGGKGNGGNKLFQTQSGEVLTSPTGATATNLQGRVIGAETVQPFIEEITETLPQFQNVFTKGKGLAQGLSNAVLGTNYSLPSQHASGKAALKEASEGLLKSFGLNATGANREALEEILAPHFGESTQGYKNRVMQQSQAFAQNKKYAKKTLRRGLSIGGGNDEVNNDPLGLR